MDTLHTNRKQIDKGYLQLTKSPITPYKERGDNVLDTHYTVDIKRNNIFLKRSKSFQNNQKYSLPNYG